MGYKIRINEYLNSARGPIERESAPVKEKSRDEEKPKGEEKPKKPEEAPE